MTVLQRLTEMAVAAAAKNRSKIACPASSSNVNDDKDHFPMTTIKEARAALGYVEHYKSKPPWWNGTLASLKAHIRASVKKWWPMVKVSD